MPPSDAHSTATRPRREDAEAHEGSGVVSEWLDAFAQAVRDRDVAAGRGLFSADAIGYGTRTVAAVGLDALVQAQWSPVWEATTGFEFTVIDRVDHFADGAAVVLARWSSRSASGADRSGRSTLVLVPDMGESGLACRHSHFSLDPVDGGRVD